MLEVGKKYIVRECYCICQESDNNRKLQGKCVEVSYLMGDEFVEVFFNDSAYILCSAGDFNHNDELPVYNDLDVKKANSDGRTNCVLCDGKIKEPYPGIRFCPVCE